MLANSRGRLSQGCHSMKRPSSHSKVGGAGVCIQHNDCDLLGSKHSSRGLSIATQTPKERVPHAGIQSLQ